MSRLDELDALFHRLHQESVDRYERKLQLSIEEKARQVQAASERQAKELPQIARLLDVPVDAITTPGFSDEAAHNRQLAELRPVLTNRPSRQAADAKQFSQHSALTLPGARTIPIYATSISAAAPEHIAEIPGVRGNPWVLPWNPGHITIRRQVLDTDYGLCGKA